MTVAVRPVTLAELEAYQRDPGEFGALLGSAVPTGWPEFPESIEFTAGQFREHPEQAPWWMQLFLVDHALVGSGGFVGPPVEGVVEIGYEIAPEFRGRGYATAAAQAMIDRAAKGEREPSRRPRPTIESLTRRRDTRPAR